VMMWVPICWDGNRIAVERTIGLAAKLEALYKGPTYALLCAASVPIAKCSNEMVRRMHRTLHTRRNAEVAAN
jgi:hypothetical protein